MMANILTGQVTSWLVNCHEILEGQGSINFPKIHNLNFCMQVRKKAFVVLKILSTIIKNLGDQVLGICAPL
jgi:hypothetical protein